MKEYLNNPEATSKFFFVDDNGETSIEDILQIVKGPDFPTGATILGTRGIEEAYFMVYSFSA